MNPNHQTKQVLFKKIQKEFIGLDTTYTLATGKTSRRIYLDSTATTLMMKPAFEVVSSFFHHYANTHSLLHFGAKISTCEYNWAHNRVLSFVGADEKSYTCFFTGSGTTAGINRMARVFRDIRPGKKIAVVSIMEHHSNDLPHRKYMEKVIHVPVVKRNGRLGCVCLKTLEQILKENFGKVNYVALTGISNVTGIINPINKAAEIAHKYDALLLVDGAQLAAHVPIRMVNPNNPAQNIDVLVFSGHKTYMPGSPGVVVAKKNLLSQIEPEEVGGGMVENVFVDHYVVKNTFPDREEAGTPNIPGAIGLATAIDVLDRIGMDFLQKEEEELIRLALEGMQKIPSMTIYGEPNQDICKRIASISFNINGLDHGLTAAVLNDYFNIAVRNECFCAHPYVKEMIMDDLLELVEGVYMNDIEEVFHLKRGMVRASFALYSTEDDVFSLINAVSSIANNKEFYTSMYHVNVDGNYEHNLFKFDHSGDFSVESCIARLID